MDGIHIYDFEGKVSWLVLFCNGKHQKMLDNNSINSINNFHQKESPKYIE